MVKERGSMMVTYINMLTVEDYNMLRKAVGWGSCNPTKVRMALDRSDFLISAQINGKTVGMARVIQDGLQALVMDVIVLLEYQRQRIGKIMMERLMEYLNGISRGGGIFINLMSAIDRDGFYGQFGFESRHNEKRGPGMTLWLDNKEDA